MVKKNRYCPHKNLQSIYLKISGSTLSHFLSFPTFLEISHTIELQHNVSDFNTSSAKISLCGKYLTQDVFHLGLLRSQTLLVTTLKRLKTISFVIENSLYRQNFQRNQYLTIKPTSLPPSHILCNRFQILLGRVMKKKCFPCAIKLR